MTTIDFDKLLKHEAWKGRKSSCIDKNGIENPFGKIDECKGIYKVYVSGGDAGKIHILPSANRDKRDATTLNRIFRENVDYDKNSEKHVIYIGKAENLRTRIKQYMLTTFGGNNHKGGIAIWAIQDYAKYLHLDVYPLSESQYTSAREWEANEINDFKKEHGGNDDIKKGNRPMANRKD